MGKLFGADGYIHLSKLPKPGDAQGSGYDKVANMSERTLLDLHLCKGRKSRCVKYGHCPDLERCCFGQRYLELKGRDRNEQRELGRDD